MPSPASASIFGVYVGALPLPPKTVNPASAWPRSSTTTAKITRGGALDAPSTALAASAAVSVRRILARALECKEQGKEDCSQYVKRLTTQVSNTQLSLEFVYSK